MFLWIKVRLEARRQAEMAWQKYATGYDFNNPGWIFVRHGSETTSREDAYWERVARIAARKLEQRIDHKVHVCKGRMYDKWDNPMMTPALVVDV